MNWIDHVEEHDGTLKTKDCPLCEEIAKFPCQWCGYGAMFYTHNLLAHNENGDPSCQGPNGFSEDKFTEPMIVEPWRDWSNP